MNRRDIFKSAGALVLVGSGILMPAHAQGDDLGLGFDLSQGTRTIDLYRPASQERLTLTYLKDGQWTAGAYEKICTLLRDVKGGGKVAHIDPKLIAMLDWTQRYLRKQGYNDPIHIISGYRGHRTNSAIARAAQNSQHLLGRAVDLEVPGLKSEDLGKIFAWLSQGGYGVYRGAVSHVDTGPIRNWRG